MALSLDRTKQLRKPHRPFISFMISSTGSLISALRLSRWIPGFITTCYELQGFTPPLQRATAHSTSSPATPMASLNNASVSQGLLYGLRNLPLWSMLSSPMWHLVLQLSLQFWTRFQSTLLHLGYCSGGSCRGAPTGTLLKGLLALCHNCGSSRYLPMGAPRPSLLPLCFWTTFG